MKKGVCVICSTEAGYGRLICPTCMEQFDVEGCANKVDYATYDPTDDKLRVYSDKVSEGLYAVLVTIGYQRAHNQGCFYSVWTPERENIALELCGHIDDEDGSIIDRATARSLRFTEYSGGAQRRAAAAHRASDAAVEGIPMGQPILVGHHSEKRHRAALKKARDQATKGFAEHQRSNYWAERARSVDSHAERMLAPGVIRRRIKKLEARRRKHLREREKEDLHWLKQQWISDNWLKWNWIPNDSHHLIVLTPQQDIEFQDHVIQRRKQRYQRYDRWIEHTEGLLLYWNVFLKEEHAEELDDQQPLKKGMWVWKWATHNRTVWGQITRVNRSRESKRITTVSVDKSSMRGETRYEYTHKWGYDDIRGYQDAAPTKAEILGEAVKKALPSATVEAKPVVANNPDSLPTPLELVERMVQEAQIFK